MKTHLVHEKLARCCLCSSCTHILYLFKGEPMTFVGQAVKQTKKESDHIHPGFSKKSALLLQEVRTDAPILAANGPSEFQAVLSTQTAAWQSVSLAVPRVRS